MPRHVTHTLNKNHCTSLLKAMDKGIRKMYYTNVSLREPAEYLSLPTGLIKLEVSGRPERVQVNLTFRGRIGDVSLADLGPVKIKGIRRIEKIMNELAKLADPEVVEETCAPLGQPARIKK